MRTIALIALPALLCFSLGCEHKKAPILPPQDQDFSCIQLFDDIGQTWGIHGCNSSNDWGNIPLSVSEKALLNFSDSVSLNGTVKANITTLLVFPCPVKIEQPLQIYVVGSMPTQPVKIKIAIVDESLQVVKELATRVNVGSGISLLVDFTQFESGHYYRMYYQISATGAPSLFEGYGNFLVCKDYVFTTEGIESECM